MKAILMKNKGIVVLTCLLCIVSSFANVAAGYMLSFLYKGISVNSLRTLFSSAALLVVVWVVALLSTYVKTLAESKALLRLNHTLRQEICNKITALNYESFHKMDSGNYVSWLTNDVNQIDSLCFTRFFSIIESTFALVFAFIALILLHYSIAVGAIVLSLFMFIVPKLVNQKIAEQSKAVSVAQEKFVESAKETVMGYDVFNGFNLLNRIHTKIGKDSNQLEGVAYRFRKKQAFVKVLIGSTNVASQLGLLFIAVYLVINQLAPAGAILSVTNLGGAFFSSLVGILNAYVALKSSQPIFEKFASQNEIDESQLMDCPSRIGLLEVKNAAYNYGFGEIFHDVNMTFENGKKYALLGESGCGKTTLVKMLLGLRNNYSGDIFIDGVDKKALKNKSLRENIAYIDQNVYLFNTTIRENITLGRSYTDEEVNWALKNSCILEFVQSLEGNLDQMIEENGKNLSGGQRQRIAIARALISGKSFLVIDEGTSAIDEKNALEIEKTLLENQDLTVVFITHHLRDEIKPKLDHVYQMGVALAS